MPSLKEIKKLLKDNLVGKWVDDNTPIIGIDENPECTEDKDFHILAA